MMTISSELDELPPDDRSRTTIPSDPAEDRGARALLPAGGRAAAPVPAVVPPAPPPVPPPVVPAATAGAAGVTSRAAVARRKARRAGRFMGALRWVSGRGSPDGCGR
ncbi:hypothetical protein KPATCC21470_8305 [Kitasatospora purpeofusca]